MEIISEQYLIFSVTFLKLSSSAHLPLTHFFILSSQNTRKLTNEALWVPLVQALSTDPMGSLEMCFLFVVLGYVFVNFCKDKKFDHI